MEVSAEPRELQLLHPPVHPALEAGPLVAGEVDAPAALEKFQQRVEGGIAGGRCLGHAASGSGSGWLAAASTARRTSARSSERSARLRRAHTTRGTRGAAV